MNVCEKCAKENQDHFKFCLGCGAEIDSPSESPRGLMEGMMVNVGPMPSGELEEMLRAAVESDGRGGQRTARSTNLGMAVAVGADDDSDDNDASD